MDSNKGFFLKIFIAILIFYFLCIDHTVEGKTTVKSTKKPPGGASKKPTSVSRKSSQNNSRFAKYKKTHKRTYATSTEEKAAQKVYEQTAKENEIHNSNPNATYTRGETSDTDKSYEWKKKHRMGLKKPEKQVNSSSVLPRMLSKRIDDIPNEADWSAWCSPIKDQSDCGACWAFAATGVLEYMQNVILDRYVTLSEQEMLDCNSDDMDCSTGGWPTNAYNYVIDSGIGSEFDYPYVSYKSECVAIQFTPVLNMNESYEIELNGDEDQLKSLVYNYGPTVVVYYATNAFTQYKSGVYNDKDCPEGDYNHAFVIVGYGTDKKLGDYWLIRNSWGTSWGMSGYGKIKRGVNLCSIATYAMLPSNSMIN